MAKNIFTTIQYVIDSILNHNKEATAHSDIRTAITDGDKDLSNQLTVFSAESNKQDYPRVADTVDPTDYTQEFKQGVLRIPLLGNGFFYVSRHKYINSGVNYYYLTAYGWEVNKKYWGIIKNGVWQGWKEDATTDKIDIQLPYVEGWSDIAGSATQLSSYSKQNDVVTVTLNALSSNPITSRTVMATLPVGYRPQNDIMFLGGNSGGGDRICLITIFSNGQVLGEPVKSINASIDRVRGSVSYVAFR